MLCSSFDSSYKSPFWMAYSTPKIEKPTMAERLNRASHSNQDTVKSKFSHKIGHYHSQIHKKKVKPITLQNLESCLENFVKLRLKVKAVYEEMRNSRSPGLQQMTPKQIEVIKQLVELAHIIHYEDGCYLSLSEIQDLIQSIKLYRRHQLETQVSQEKLEKEEDLSNLISLFQFTKLGDEKQTANQRC